MKLVQLLHNPGAGAQEFKKNELIALLSQNGYNCRYLSTKKKGWKDFKRNTDIVLIAGGDGTIRKVVAEILNGRLWKKPERLAIFPLGTANNISRSLNIGTELKTAIQAWRRSKHFRYDVGIVNKIPGNRFFLESFGFGAFPALMQKMETLDEKTIDTPEKSLSVALEQLHKIVLSYPAFYCEIEIDGKDHSGTFLLAEVMNTSSIGPNLNISPSSHPGDGKFEIILVSDKDRKKIAEYVEALKDGKQKKYTFNTLKGKKIKMLSQSPHAHADDQIVEITADKTIGIHLKRGLLNFLVPK